MIISGIRYSNLNDRIDAEYYQPRYLEIERLLDSVETVAISDVCDVSDLRYDPAKEPETLFRYIEIENVDPITGWIQTQEIKGAEAPSRARKIVRVDNVIVSTVRPSRRIVGLVDKELDGSLCSTGFCVLIPRKTNPYMLFCLMKTSLVTNQLVRRTMASMYPVVTETDILKVRIPSSVLETPKKGEISRLIKQTRELGKLSLDKLAIAFRILEDLTKKQSP